MLAPEGGSLEEAQPQRPRDRMAVWRIRWLPMTLLMLPGAGLIIASFFVEVEAMEEGDLHPLMFLGLLFVAIIIGLMTAFTLRNRARMRLLKAGLPGTAEVVSMRQTGTVNDMPLMSFTLRVSDGRSPDREVEHRQTITRLALRDIRVGDTLAVRVHPRKPDRLLVLY